MKPKRGNSLSFISLIRTFWPLFLISSFLPVLFFGVQSNTPFSLFSRADSPNSMRVWLEPATVIAHTGQNVSLNILTELDKPQSLLPSVAVTVVSEETVSIDTPEIIYRKPFGGKIIAGQVTIKAQQPGTYHVTIPQNSVQTGGVAVDSITTGGTTLIIK